MVYGQPFERGSYRPKKVVQTPAVPASPSPGKDPGKRTRPSERDIIRQASGRSPRWARLKAKRQFRRGANLLNKSKPGAQEKALQHFAKAARGSRKLDPHWPSYNNNYGVALLDRCADASAERLSDLDAAVARLTAAYRSVPRDSVDRGRVIGNLIRAIEARTRPGLPPASFTDDLLPELRRELATMTTLPLALRLAAARSQGRSAAQAGKAAMGLSAYSLAIDLLPRVTWLQNRRARQDVVDLLSAFPGLASEAAACALSAGSPARAVELLERGRSILWTQKLTPGSVRDGVRAADPGLAKKMDRLVDLINDPLGLAGDWRMAQVGWFQRGPRRIDDWLGLRWREMAVQAADHAPFGQLLAPEYVRDLRPAAEQGPVVIVNLSPWRCDAIVVTGDARQPAVVRLTEITYQEVADQANTYLTVLADPDARRRERTVTDILDWLWRTVAAPILRRIELPARPSGRPPRLWWCPTGPLTMLPLHAAAARPTDRSSLGPAVMDRVVSSYTPNLLALRRARSAWWRRQSQMARLALEGAGRTEAEVLDILQRRMLLVTVGDQEGHPSLPGAAQVSAYLQARIPASRRTVLSGADPTVERVRTLLKNHTWAHFDCHGIQDLQNPFNNGLALHDGTLTVSDLAAIRHDRAEFAFLAACTTAAPGPSVPDESITLTAALMFAEYQAVIGTLATVPDRPTARVTQAVYRRLVHGGRLRPPDSASALHHAIIEERRRRPHHPSAWSSFMHVGL